MDFQQGKENITNNKKRVLIPVSITILVPIEMYTDLEIDENDVEGLRTILIDEENIDEITKAAAVASKSENVIYAIDCLMGALISYRSKHEAKALFNPFVCFADNIEV